MKTALAALERMPDNEKLEVYAELTRDADAYYRDNPWDFAVEQVWTQDEAARTISRWPDIPYLQEIFGWIEQEPHLGFPKSRRMKASWAVCIWATHRTRYFASNAVFIQSETEAKAAYLVQERCQFIEDHLDNPMLRRPYAALRTSEGLVGRLTYDQTGSYIWALAEGADKLRTFTPSALILDEVEHQREAHKAYVAALPTVEKGSKLIALGSSNGPMGLLAGICKEAGYLRHTG